VTNWDFSCFAADTAVEADCVGGVRCSRVSLVGFTVDGCSHNRNKGSVAHRVVAFAEAFNTAVVGNTITVTSEEAVDM
jgi:hypothetical protein